MLGKRQIAIDATQFVQGLSTSDYIPDGGIGTSSYNINPVATPGVIRATPSYEIDDDDTVAGSEYIAACEDPRASTSSSANLVLLDNDGHFYTLSGNDISLRASASSGTGYTAVTDMVVFQGNIYVSKADDLVQVTVPSSLSSSWTLDEDWWDSTKGQSALTNVNTPHPLIVFENSLWVGDSEDLHQIDENLNVTANKLTLNTNDRIQSLGIDPSTGLMMIGITTVAVIDDDQLAARYFIGLYDGYSSKLRRRVPVDGIVTSFRNVGGNVYVTYGANVGVWNGSGITFLRHLSNADINNLPLKFLTDSVKGTYYVADGQHVLAHGELVPGKRIWYPVFKNQVDSSDITFFAYAGNAASEKAYFVWSNDTSNLYGFAPFDVETAGVGVFYTPKINMERPIFLRGMDVFTTGITSTAGIGGIAVINEEEVTKTPAVSTFVVASGTKRKFHFDFDTKLQTLQGKLTLDTQAFGISRVVFYYDVAE